MSKRWILRIRSEWLDTSYLSRRTSCLRLVTELDVTISVRTVSPPLSFPSPTVLVSFSRPSYKTGATPLSVPSPTGVTKWIYQGTRTNLTTGNFVLWVPVSVRCNSSNMSLLTTGKQTHMKCGATWLELVLQTQNTELKIQQLTRVFVNTDPTWSMTYCYMKYTGDWTGIAWYTGMEKSIFAQHPKKNPNFF